MTEIRNVRIINHGKTNTGSIFFENGKICAKPENSVKCEVIDGKGMYASAGFIDMHLHGSLNYDFMDMTQEGFEAICEKHLQHGVTTIVPTSSTGSFDTIKKMIDNQKYFKEKRKDRQTIPGIHIEGQYIAMARDGGMDTRFIHSPIKEEYEDVIKYADGNIIRWSVAPELEGAMEFGDYCKEHGILASIAHTDATYDDVREAMAHGFSHITHIYSDMNSITRHNGFRIMGVLEAAYDLPIDVEIISDGCHIPPDLFRYIVRHIDHQRINLVSDCIRGAGIKGKIINGEEIVDVGENGRHLEGVVEDGVVKFLDRSAFHGSIAQGNMLIKAANLKCGIRLEDCIEMITENPARMLGLKDKGTLDIGKDADIVLFDENIDIVAIFHKGNKIEKNSFAV